MDPDTPLAQGLLTDRYLNGIPEEWVLRDGIVTSVLIGASKTSQILDNIKAIQNTAFSEEELKQIEEIYFEIT